MGDTPLGRWMQQNRRTLANATPWAVSGITALVVGWAANGITGFSVVLAIEGALLGLWATYLTVQAAQDGRELRRIVEHAAAREDLRNIEALRSEMGMLESRARVARRRGQTRLVLSELESGVVMESLSPALWAADVGRELLACHMLVDQLSSVIAPGNDVDFMLLISAAVSEVEEAREDAWKWLDRSGRPGG